MMNLRQQLLDEVLQCTNVSPPHQCKNIVGSLNHRHEFVEWKHHLVDERDGGVQNFGNAVFANISKLHVKWWITFNEPAVFVKGYSGTFPPAVTAPGVGNYLAAHNVLKAHARVYHVYNDHFRSQQKGKIGITLSFAYSEPKTDSNADIDATERYRQFNLGWFAHPIYSKEGDYPAIMKKRIAKRSKEEGLARSRLPEFGEYWVNYIRGAYDFYGMNFYSSFYISEANKTTSKLADDDSPDMGSVVVEQDPNWPVGCNSEMRYTPFGLRKILKWVSDNYNNVPILITENGWCDTGEMNDTMRIRYLVNHYASVMDAIHLDNVTVLGHTTWSLIDTFEWNTIANRYGLYNVNFSDTQKTRTPKESSKVISSIMKTRTLPEKYLDKE